MRHFVLALAIVAAPVGAPSASTAQTRPAGAPLFTVELAFSPRALATLQRRNEKVIVSPFLEGEPLPRYRSRGDETTGLIDLGTARITVPARAGPVAIPAGTLKRDRLAWVVRGSARVNVNVYSARLSGPDNLLDCGIVEGPLATISGTTQRIRCKLIGEP